MVVRARRFTNILDLIVTIFAHGRLDVRDVGTSTSAVGKLRGCAVATCDSGRRVRLIIGRLRGGVTIIGTRCFARSRVCFCRMTLCGISAPIFRRGQRTSGVVEGRGTHVIRIGAICSVVRCGNVDRSVARVCRRLSSLNYVLRFIHSNHITVAGSGSRRIARCLGHERRRCGGGFGSVWS